MMCSLEHVTEHPSPSLVALSHYSLLKQLTAAWEILHSPITFKDECKILVRSQLMAQISGDKQPRT